MMYCDICGNLFDSYRNVLTVVESRLDVPSEVLDLCPSCEAKLRSYIRSLQQVNMSPMLEKLRKDGTLFVGEVCEFDSNVIEFDPSFYEPGMKEVEFRVPADMPKCALQGLCRHVKDADNDYEANRSPDGSWTITAHVGREAARMLERKVMGLYGRDGLGMRERSLR